MKKILVLFPIIAFLFLSAWFGSGAARADSETVTFAVIGDFGLAEAQYSGEGAVADMVAGWNPEFIITTGDNY